MSCCYCLGVMILRYVACSMCNLFCCTQCSKAMRYKENDIYWYNEVTFICSYKCFNQKIRASISYSCEVDYHKLSNIPYNLQVVEFAAIKHVQSRKKIELWKFFIPIIGKNLFNIINDYVIYTT